MHKISLFLPAVSMLAALSGCSAGEAPADDPDGGKAVYVSAYMTRQLLSRADDDSRIVTGEYQMTYPASVSGGQILTETARVEFTGGIGVVYAPVTNEQLKWVDVEGSTPTFYLDNVAPGLAGDGSDATTVVFDKSGSIPYSAGLYQGDASACDLLWGSSLVSRNAKTINFDLHHCMSRLCVKVTVDHRYELDNELDLSGASVYITSLALTPESYNRLDGSLSLGDVPDYTDFTLVGDSFGWKLTESYTGDDGTEFTVYTTQDFVLPPQDLQEDEKRPKLVIDLGNGRVYSGILPHAMLIEDADPSHTEPSYPVALSFLREHILTIRTVITEEPPSLEFMPVEVVDWVDKGEHYIEAHQAGIYTAEEFYKLIEYYKAGNEYQLTRYGRLVEDEDGGQESWVFDFFFGVTLDYDRIKGGMSPGGEGKKPFIFNFNNYTNYIQWGGKGPDETLTLDAGAGPRLLYEVVTGARMLP